MQTDRQPLVNELSEVLRTHPELELALLFGSVARGQASVGSDIDLAVRGRGLDVLTLASELSERCATEVDVLSLDDELSLALQSELLRDAVCVHEARAGNYAAWRARTLWNIETDGPAIERAQRAWLARLAAGSAR
jgi:uncharacterized protein